jgi:hypothetical protein
MKPRLKLLPGRRLAVVRTGTSPWSEERTRRELMLRYGSLRAFADTWGFTYDTLAGALRSNCARDRAGQTHDIRLALGLVTHPTEASKKAVAVRMRQLQSREPDFVFGEPEVRT